MPRSRVLNYLVKLLKEELLTSLFPGCPPTCSVFDLHVIVLVIA